jgi:hypothetical protein
MHIGQLSPEQVFRSLPGLSEQNFKWANHLGDLRISPQNARISFESLYAPESIHRRFPTRGVFIRTRYKLNGLCPKGHRAPRTAVRDGIAEMIRKVYPTAEGGLKVNEAAFEGPKHKSCWAGLLLCTQISRSPF